MYRASAPSLALSSLCLIVIRIICGKDQKQAFKDWSIRAFLTYFHDIFNLLFVVHLQWYDMTNHLYLGEWLCAERLIRKLYQGIISKQNNTNSVLYKTSVGVFKTNYTHWATFVQFSNFITPENSRKPNVSWRFHGYNMGKFCKNG